HVLLPLTFFSILTFSLSDTNCSSFDVHNYNMFGRAQKSLHSMHLTQAHLRVLVHV
ncbi:hypothetical protein BJV77DRAFT_1012147, partial [Russula vinacea]